jgi:hypothetical protein
MPQIPSVSQAQLAITATQFSSFATPAITVPFPSVYAGQTQIPFTFSATPTYAATRIPTTLGGQAATAGVHSINSEASAAGYRTHDYGNNGGGSGWPVWATAVIATAGGLAVILVVVGLLCWRHRKRQKANRRANALAGAQGPQGFKERKDFYRQPGGDGGRGGMAGTGAAIGGAAALGEKSRRSHRPPAVDTQGPEGRPTAYGQGDYPMQPYANAPTQSTRPDQPITPTRPTSFAQQQQYSAAPPGFPAYVPFRNHQREDSAGSNTGLLPPAAGFAYGENSPDHHGGWATTPPRRAPNDYAGDSPHSPAHLLVNANGNGNGYGQGYGYNDTPRSSTTVSTGGTGGDPYRWDQDPDLADHMPNPEESSAALGRAMMMGGGGGVQHGNEEYHHPLSAASGGGASTNPVTPERHHLPTGYRLSAEQDASAYGARAAPAQRGGGGGGGSGSMALAAAYAHADRAPSPASYPPPVSRPHSRNASRPRSAAAAAARDSAYEGRRSVTPSSAVSGGRRSVDGYEGGGGSSSRGSSRPRSAQPPVSLAPPIALPRRSLDQQQQSTGRRSLDAAPSRRPTSRTSNYQQHRRSAYDPSWDDASVYSDQQDAAVRSSTPNALVQQAANFVGRRPSRSYRPAQ